MSSPLSPMFSFSGASRTCSVPRSHLLPRSGNRYNSRSRTPLMWRIPNYSMSISSLFARPPRWPQNSRRPHISRQSIPRSLEPISRTRFAYIYTTFLQRCSFAARLSGLNSGNFKALFFPLQALRTGV